VDTWWLNIGINANNFHLAGCSRELQCFVTFGWLVVRNGTFPVKSFATYFQRLFSGTSGGIKPTGKQLSRCLLESGHKNRVCSLFSGAGAEIS